MALTKVSRGLLSTSIEDNGNATAITIDSSENVGIGTSTIIGSASNRGVLTLSGASSSFLTFGTGSTRWGGVYSSASNTIFLSDSISTFETGGTERMRIDSSGNVGIGTSSPANKFVVAEGTNQHGIELAAGTTSYIQAYDRATSDYGDLKIDAQTIAFGTDNGSERMRIDSSGNLLVGKTSISAAFTGIMLRGSTGESFFSIASANNTLHVYDTTNSLYRFYVNANGGISNYSANNINLSDEREKKNIEPLESQWDSLKQWSLKKFHYNADADSENKKYGVIAQEVETHNPEVIDEFNVDDETTRMAVKEQQMMWMAIKALQEAQTRIETLEARVTELENN